MGFPARYSLWKRRILGIVRTCVLIKHLLVMIVVGAAMPREEGEEGYVESSHCGQAPGPDLLVAVKLLPFQTPIASWCERCRHAFITVIRSRLGE